MITDTIIFTGPSITPIEAKQYLPNAAYHKPIKCGDIIKCLRLNPKRLIIIDGFFEQTGSVWHKEILLAISLGIEVFGSSSMGAIRAAELDRFGMLGFGKIYHNFKSGNPDDDEVTLVHEPDFAMRIIPMCNIRATLQKAILNKKTTQKEADSIISTLKSLPYFQRAFFEHIDNKTLRDWCKENSVDQKKIDAIEMLEYAASTPIHHSTCKPYSQTVFFNKLFIEMNASPFEDLYPFLPHHEKTLHHLSKSPLWPGIARYSRLTQIAENLKYNDCTQEETLKKWVKYLRIYDNCSHEALQPIYIKSAVLYEKIISQFNRFNVSLNPRLIQQFSNQFRLKYSLFNEAQTLEWAQKVGIKNINSFNEFMNMISIIHTIVDEHHYHLLNITIPIKFHYLKQTLLEIPAELDEKILIA